MNPLTVDEVRAVRLLAQSVSREEVEAVCPGVDLDAERIVDAAAWLRGTGEAAAKLTPDYLRVSMMSAIEEEIEEPDPADIEAAEEEGRPPKTIKRRALAAKDRARLLALLAKMK